MKTLFFITGKTSEGCLTGSLTKDAPWFQEGHDNHCGKYENTCRNMLAPPTDMVQARRPVPHHTVLPDMPCGGAERIAPGHSGGGKRIRSHMHDIPQGEPTGEGQGDRRRSGADGDDDPDGMAPPAMQSPVMQAVGAGELPDEGPVDVHVRGDGPQGQGHCVQPGGAALLQAEHRHRPPCGGRDVFDACDGDGAEGAVDKDVVIAVHDPQCTWSSIPSSGSFDDDAAR